MEKYDITDYLKDDKELQKAVIEEFLKEIAELEAKNEKLKEENEKLNKMTGIFSARLCEKYRQALQEIKQVTGVYNEVIQKITKAVEE